MSIPKLTADLAVIQKLSDLPNATEGLSAEQLKAKFDEAAETIQTWINETLIPAIKAENIPFAATAEIEADNVDSAIHAVYEQIQNAATGAIVNGSVTKEKLAAELLERVFGGRVWVSFDKPAVSDNPDTEFPVGQLWLRPAHAVYNLEAGNWSTSGCTAETSGCSLRLTGNRTVATISATQTISNIGQAGDRVYVVLDVAERDSELTVLTGSFDGGEAFELAEKGVYEIVLAGTALTVQITAQWPATSLAYGSVVLENVTVINPDVLQRKYPGTHDRKNWTSWLRENVPFAEAESDREMYVQTQPGVWQLFDQEVSPVSRGGTGLTEIGDGDILYGKNGGFARLEKPDEASFLESGGTPAWTPIAALADHGFARIATGSYVGTGASRTITLPVTPKLLVISTDDPDEREGDGMFQQGITRYQIMSGQHKDGSITEILYNAGLTLTGDKLTTVLRYTNNVLNPAYKGWNKSGVTYPWVAVY